MIDARISFLKDYTCDEFLGPCQKASEDREDDLVSQLSVELTAQAQPFPLSFLDDKPGFALLGPLHAPEPDLYLVQQTEHGPRLAGLYQGDTVGVLLEFWGTAGLGRELILAAFYQCQWKNKDQHYTKRGLNSVKRAHRYIVKRAIHLGIRNCDRPACTCQPDE